MKRVVLVVVCLLSLCTTYPAQTLDTFDIATFQTPKGWQKQAGESSRQISTEDKATGAYCLITLFRSLPGAGNSKENFDSAWQKVVKGIVNISAAPQMASPANDNGWEVQSGVASGYVGTIKFQSVRSSGKFTAPNNWQVSLSDIQGKPRTFNAYFSAVKGGRMLWLDGKAYGKVE
ncbi:hypothetical protein BH10ACI3_BH10ACI3_17540 [soil metagenome]